MFLYAKFHDNIHIRTEYCGKNNKLISDIFDTDPDN